MKFELQNIEMLVSLGVENFERAQKQKVLVSFSFEYDTSNAETSDDIKDTINYFKVQQTIQNFAHDKEFHLLEKLHADLLHSLKNSFPKMKSPLLSIEKFPFESGSIVLKNNKN